MAAAQLDGPLGAVVGLARVAMAGYAVRVNGWPDELSPAAWPRQYREGKRETAGSHDR